MTKHPNYAKTEDELKEEIQREADWITGGMTRLAKQLAPQSETPLKTVRGAYETACAMTGHVTKIRTRLAELMVRLAMKE